MNRLLFLLVFVGIVFVGMAQITITNADLPQPGDTLRVSMANQVPGDFTQTAYDTTWDFSALAPVTQRVESFVPITSVPLEFMFVFIPNIVSNLASPGNTNLPIPGFPISDSYTFYNNISTGFSDVGNASKVGGIPLALRYDVPDLWYPFPLSPGMTWSSSSFAELSIPSLAYISNARTRSSIADGWGTLITPFGTFSTIRVKSDLVQRDSIAMDTMGINLPFTRSITQYKWLAPGEGIPVLQVNVELGMVSAIYRDVYRPDLNPMTVDLGPDTSVLKGQPITLTAAVTNGAPPYTYVWSNFATTPSVTLVIDSTITTGVAVFDALNNIAFDMITISVKYAPGINENPIGRLHIEPNPARGDFKVTLPGNLRSGNLIIRDLTGRQVFTAPFDNVNGSLGIHSEALVPGYYLVTISSGSSIFTGTLLIK